MEINHRIDLDVPAEFVFGKLTDVESITANLPSNIILRTETGHSRFDEGSKWVIRAQRTGRKFVVHTEIKNVVKNEILEFSTFSNRLLSDSSVIIHTLSEQTSVVQFNIAIRPKGLLGRILLQSLKASRRRVNERLETSGVKIKAYLEDAYQAQKG